MTDNTPKSLTSGDDRFDYRMIESLRAIQVGGEAKQLLDKVIVMYSERAPLMIDSLKTAIAENDCSTMNFVAHSLKSSSHQLGLMEMVEICLDFEHLAKINSRQEIAKKIARLDAAFFDAADFLNEVKNEG